MQPLQCMSTSTCTRAHEHRQRPHTSHVTQEETCLVTWEAEAGGFPSSRPPWQYSETSTSEKETLETTQISELNLTQKVETRGQV